MISAIPVIAAAMATRLASNAPSFGHRTTASQALEVILRALKTEGIL